MALIKDRFIPKEEFMRLLFTKIDGVNTHELSIWLKSQTNNQWVVVPKTFCDLLLQFIEAFNKNNLLVIEKETLETFENLKKYL
jgi:malic enzyme